MSDRKGDQFGRLHQDSPVSSTLSLVEGYSSYASKVSENGNTVQKLGLGVVTLGMAVAGPVAVGIDVVKLAGHGIQRAYNSIMPPSKP